MSYFSKRRKTHWRYPGSSYPRAPPPIPPPSPRGRLFPPRLIPPEACSDRSCAIASIATGNLDTSPVVGPRLPFIPSQMRCACIGARRRQWHDGGIVTAVSVSTPYGGVLNFRNKIAFPHPWCGDVQNAPMLFLYDSPGPAHVDQFLFGFDRPLPIHQRRRVFELGV